MTADQVIQALDLKPLPGEGGYFSETYRASYTTQNVNVPGGQLANRSASTAIYYMVTPQTFSALHRLPQDEVFHFYMGEPAELFVIFPNGQHQLFVLGDDIAKGQRPQVVVPAGSWQGTRLRQGSSGFALLGTTVAPGFEFADMELGKRDELLSKYPDKRDFVLRYTVGE